MTTLYQVLTPEGVLLESIDGLLDETAIVAMYENMVLVRAFDRKAIILQRQGRMGTYAPFEGQEAAQVGSAFALTPGDWLFPTYRDHAAAIVHGQSMARVFLYWMGHMEGSISPQGRNIMPPCVPIATQMVHAVGTAWASKLKQERQVSLAFFGDGASSEGDFHESLNFAGVFKTPTIFLCQNNGFAISVPFTQQSASQTIAQRAAAYDMPGVRIDGNDIFAVWLTMKAAIKRGLAGQGPTLIEAITYRYGAHTTADDPKKYRDQDVVSQEWRSSRDPLARLKKYMERMGYWDDVKEALLLKQVTERIEAALAEAESYPKSKPTDMFKHVYAEPTWMAIEQERELQEPERKKEVPA